MVVYQQTLQKPYSCSVHESIYLNWSSVYANIPKMYVLMLVNKWTCQCKLEQAGKESQSPSMYVIQADNRRCDSDKGRSSDLKRSGLRVGFFT